MTLSGSLPDTPRSRCGVCGEWYEPRAQTHAGVKLWPLLASITCGGCAGRRVEAARALPADQRSPAARDLVERFELLSRAE